ncbi:MAG: bifunctional riboflavin kinase/FAD synthetase [Candidatus Marinimicrobia bacterium]|nr:bifunctional riboflavin kinase/FAD synthetase [Candidatus Neomarinimicrobiota bacterium]MBL7023497.1 bifunctional riboflavin kinase/FAD synthetase [Candidatus Neomarinimicrobiota bacterium]MBL7109544.1 bifunctional riboflavin kinase/FAD synthetase [Candidatus Neomarinimicrobiota bacterium]
MVVIRSINETSITERCVVTLGNFDGIHLGHSAILNKTVELAKQKNLKSVVITFHPHPKRVLETEILDNKYLITDLQTKSELIGKNGIDYLLVIPFDEKQAEISADEFLRDLIIEKFQPTDIVTGYDHHFGFERKGNSEFLKSHSELYNYEFHIVKPILIDDEIVSSSKIRNCLASNQIIDVNKMLGRPYKVIGRVEKGLGRGKQLNFPTANIVPIDENQIIPSDGVYCVTVEIEENTFRGMCNIGNRPTFEENSETSIIEVNLFSEDQRDIYYKDIVVKFHNFVRDEKKFDSVENLKEQLQIDKIFCKKQLIEV